MKAFQHVLSYDFVFDWTVGFFYNAHAASVDIGCSVINLPEKSARFCVIGCSVSDDAVLDCGSLAVTIAPDMPDLRFVSVNQTTCPRLDHSGLNSTFPRSTSH